MCIMELIDYKYRDDLDTPIFGELRVILKTRVLGCIWLKSVL